MPTSTQSSPEVVVHLHSRLTQENKDKLGASSVPTEPILRSPTSSQEKPSTEIRLPASPTSTADLMLVLDEDLVLEEGTSLRSSNRRRLSSFDDELSQWSDDGGEEFEEELLGLSLLEDDTAQSGTK